MQNNFKRSFLSILIIMIIPLISACTREESINNEELKHRFDVITKTFKEPFDNGTLKLYDKYTCATLPSVEMALASVFKADPYLAAKKLPQYKDFHGAKLNTNLIDDGFVAVSDDFYILINNDGCKPHKISFYIDINGKKGPNKLGHDLFLYDLAKGDVLIPVEYTAEAQISKYYFKEL